MGSAYGDVGACMTPNHRRLVLAVFRQAVKDFRKCRVLSRRATYNMACENRDQQTAIDFLCDDTGSWAQSRRAWARLIRLHEDRLHKWAVKQRQGDLNDSSRLSSRNNTQA